MTTIERIILVKRKTRLEELIYRYNTKKQVAFYLQTRNQDISDYQLEYDNYYQSLDMIQKQIPKDFKFQILDREFLPNYIFTEKDMVIVLGQDGLVVNTAKYLNGQPIFAINPDPDRFDGVLLPFLPSDFASFFFSALENRLPYKNITMAEAKTNDGQNLYAFNDFFIGARTHVSARYIIRYKERSERHISSGVIISTPAGSTGWLSSVFNMANGLLIFYSRKEKMNPIRMQWEDKKLIFAVREPFYSKWSGVSIVCGEILEEESLILESQMPEEGVIFSDGIEKDFISFNSGCIVTIKVASKITKLMVKPVEYKK